MKTIARNKLAALATILSGLATAACQSDSLFSPMEPLTAEARLTMDSLMFDGWQSEATYRQVTRELGNVDPFRGLLEVQVKNTERLLNAYRYYAMFPPANRTGASKVEASGKLALTMSAACAASVERESRQAARYGSALKMEAPGNVKQIWDENRVALERELTAAKRCAPSVGR